jgi:hypothetical protein
MVNQDHGQVELALQIAQEAEYPRDLGRIVFIDAMPPDEGIEDQQDQLEGLDRVGQELAIGVQVQAQGQRGRLDPEPERGTGADSGRRNEPSHDSSRRRHR